VRHLWEFKRKKIVAHKSKAIKQLLTQKTIVENLPVKTTFGKNISKKVEDHSKLLHIYFIDTRNFIIYHHIKIY